MKEKTKSYMAGLMDAEGCIRMNRRVRGDKIYYSPAIFLSNESRRAVKWAVQHFGGSFALNKNNKAGGDWYLWYVQSTEHAAKVLGLVLPYLKIKKPQAELLARFCSSPASFLQDDRDKCFFDLKEMKTGGSVTTDTHSDYIKADQAYLAGFFDGEGCIKITRLPVRNTVSYHLAVNVTNTNLAVLEMYRSMFGGFISHKSGGRCYDWGLAKKEQVEKFLLHVLPYLIIKREEALAGLEYLRLARNTPAEKERLYALLRSLKKSKIQSDLLGDEQCASLETVTA